MLPKIKRGKTRQVPTEFKSKIYFKSIESAIPFYQVAKNKLQADKYVEPDKLFTVVKPRA